MKKLLAIIAASMLTVAAAQAAEFAEVDGDGDGMVSMEEAKAAMPDLSDEAFSGADSDGDGSLNEEEFASLSE